MRRVGRSLLVSLLLAGLATGGCAALPIASLVAEVVSGTIGIYQRYEQRKVDLANNERLKALEAEIKKTREILHEDLDTVHQDHVKDRPNP